MASAPQPAFRGRCCEALALPSSHASPITSSSEGRAGADWLSSPAPHEPCLESGQGVQIFQGRAVEPSGLRARPPPPALCTFLILCSASPAEAVLSFYSRTSLQRHLSRDFSFPPAGSPDVVDAAPALLGAGEGGPGEHSRDSGRAVRRGPCRSWRGRRPQPGPGAAWR